MSHRSRAMIIIANGCLAILVLALIVGSTIREDREAPAVPAPVPAATDPHQELRQHIEWCRGMIFQQSQAIDTMASEIREFKNTLDPMILSPRPITTGAVVWVEAAQLMNGNPLWDQLVTEAGGMLMYKDSESYRKWVHPATEVQP